MTLRSLVGTGSSAVAARIVSAAAAMMTNAANLLLERVREFFDDGVREEPLAHLPKLRFDVFPCLPSVRKRDAKQLADADIFHAAEAERAERVLDGLAL